MKKTLTINLGGTVYHIDEDAYILLDNYLNNLRYHFRKSEGAEEIVRDMEARIAELFDEYLHQGHQVVTIEEVEAVIARMGKPEELNDGTEEGEATAGQTAGPDPSEEVTRRLFRDPDDRILGGVASGWAAYLGLDATWIRIILILIGLFFHGIIFLYLICWIVMPLAHTATEKLQMRGKPVNVENIGKTVTDGFEHVNESIRSEKTQSFLHQLAGGLTRFIGGLLKILLIIVAVCLVPVLLGALVALFALILAAAGILVSVPAFFYQAMPYIDWGVLGTMSAPAVAFAICGLVVVALPVIGLLQLLMQSFGRWKPMSTWTKVLLILLWLVAVGFAMYSVFHASFFMFPDDTWLINS
ncbi:PspC domain-containing protein [Phocaeicola barnesiae]|uniref:PspC domain-containing protein n=1 Tax=Phocaeicola barnesiae TaxID=376804 RepID=UPI001F44A318|nr:PspC domain-containing protein [Phocaeicola barnesiae]MCF2575088.1 PspC domain-containing protein [Phocaeicola barnesiae]